MKTKLLTCIIMLFSLTVKAQNGTAYAYFFINASHGGKDVYVFTSPKPFKYIAGSSYVSAPVGFEKIAKASIESKVKDYDPSFNGLYINQISNGENISMKNMQDTQQGIVAKMSMIYNTQQRAQYRGNDVIIVQIDMETGRSISEYTLPATKINRNTSGAGNAN